MQNVIDTIVKILVYAAIAGWCIYLWREVRKSRSEIESADKEDYLTTVKYVRRRFIKRLVLSLILASIFIISIVIAHQVLTNQL